MPKFFLGLARSAVETRMKGLPKNGWHAFKYPYLLTIFISLLDGGEIIAGQCKNEGWGHELPCHVLLAQCLKYINDSLYSENIPWVFSRCDP